MTLPSDFSDRLAKISVGLRQDLRVTRQEVRQETRYVFHDPTSFQNHAFGLDEYRVMTAIVADGTLEEVFSGLVARGVMQVEERDEFFGFVLSLHGMGLLHLPLNDAGRLYEKYRRRREAARKALYMAPMYLKVPAWDPDAFLERTFRFVRPLFSRRALLVWGGLWLLVLWNLLGQFESMLAEASQLFALGNVPLLYLAVVGLKILHEFGHGYACKKYGGEVPEMGAAFIVCTPCAYVDASASWKFDNRWQRIAVGMAGMYVESWLAAVFALVWIGTAPGLLHAMALNVCILATATTVLFNLNPLMKFDGYYVFADLVGTVNLRERSARFLKSWASFRFLGLGDKPSCQGRDRLLLSTYGTASFFYKISLAFGVTSMMVLQWPTVGALAGVFFGLMMIVVPICKLLRWLWRDAETAPVRVRARFAAVGLATVMPVGLAGTPVSHSVATQGVLESEHRQVLRAPSDGFVSRVCVDRGEYVTANDTVVELTDEATELNLRIVAEQLRAEQTQQQAYHLTDPARAAYHGARAQYFAESLAELRDRRGELSVKVAKGGVVVDAEPHALLGHHVKAGAPLVEVDGGAQLVHALLPAKEVHRAHIAVDTVAWIRWAVAPARVTPARVVRILPVASRADIPAALTMAKGGSIYTAKGMTGEESAVEPYVHVLLAADWVPEGFHANLTAGVLFSAEVRTLGHWLHTQVVDLYRAWRLSQ
ncbi:MAG: hypothetical protein AAF628_36360 [Planctomycetota bacterium]